MKKFSPGGGDEMLLCVYSLVSHCKGCVGDVCTMYSKCDHLLAVMGLVSGGVHDGLPCL